MATLSDFSGVMTVLAPSATASLNAAGNYITVQSNRFLSMGPIAVGGTTAQNDPIAAFLLSPTAGKKIVGAAKTAAEAWTAGQTVYLISATNIYTTTKGTNTVGGIAAADATSAATVGDVIPTIPFVQAV